MNRGADCAVDDPDSDLEADPGQLLDELLGELTNFSGGVDALSAAASGGAATTQLRPLNVAETPRIDSYRFSMANLEDSQDVDLDAILGELNMLETQCDIDLVQARGRILITETDKLDAQHQSRTHIRTTSSESTAIGHKMPPSSIDTVVTGRVPGNGDEPLHHLVLKSTGAENSTNGAGVVARTDSPDNDSAFSDTVSMLSSESSASSGGSGTKPQPLQLQLTGTDEAARAKQEKIRMAMEKIKEANIQKLFVKVFMTDGCVKSLLVDEKMACSYVTRLLADKNHVPMDPKWALVEHLPELYMERVYEDHELLVENLMLWTRDSKNKIYFSERPDKTVLFMQPERFLLSDTDCTSNRHSIPLGGSTDTTDEHTRNMILEEYFATSSATSAAPRNLPEVEGPLYLKADSKKAWKKYYCVLRASGLYYYPKEKARTSADLVCLMTFENNHVYYGIGWKKKFKAPTDYCFAIKHPRLQEAKATKYIKYLCADDPYILQRWMVGVRLAKHGRQLMDNYRQLLEELAQEDLDKLAHARSCSVSSIAVQSNVTTPTQGYPASEVASLCNDTYSTPSEISSGLGSSTVATSLSSNSRHSRASSSSSSGCQSDTGTVSSSCSGGGGGSGGILENAFDSELTTGTIKRKPSMKPSLPLTSITRQLKEVGETTTRDAGCGGMGLYTSSGTLTRRHSRRKSNSDDGSNSGTLKRQHNYKTRGSIESIKSGNSTPIITTPTTERASPFGDRPYEERPSSVNSLRSPTNSIDMPSMTDSIMSLPPPPEPCDDPPLSPTSAQYLPAPPPEHLYHSTLSLDSLPPPPHPADLPSLGDNGGDLTGSQLSLMSLPPPPPSPHHQTTESQGCGNTDTIRRRKGSSSSSTTTSGTCTPTNDRTPILSPDGSSTNLNTNTTPTSKIYNRLNGNNGGSSPDNSNNNLYVNQQQLYENCHPTTLTNSVSFNHSTSLTNGGSGGLRSSLRRQISSNSHYSLASELHQQQNVGGGCSPVLQKRVNFQGPSSPKRSLKKISFNLPGTSQVDAPALPRKPPPPVRSENTKLTSPKKLVEPPRDFLKDLQRVMRKKWQVAQKCKEEPQTTPHEVLGFRDPPAPLPDYKASNVSNWVQEHYGPNNFYENVYADQQQQLVEGGVVTVATSPTAVVSDTSETVAEYATSPVHLYGNVAGCRTSTSSSGGGSKRPPPPPPKRSETTHLTNSAGKSH